MMVIDDYGDGEERDWGCECHLKGWKFDCASEII